MSKIAIGKHPYGRQGRLVWVTSHGVWTPDEVRHLIAFLEAEQTREPRLGLLLDVSGGASVGPEARRALAERTNKEGSTVPVAVVGASLAIRAFLTMVIRTVQLFGGPAAPVAFFASEAEGQAWLESYRFRDESHAAS